jgi:hypothetical protein
LRKIALITFIVYLIGNENYLGKGLRKQIIKQLIEKIKIVNGKEIIVQPDIGNKPSQGVLTIAGLLFIIIMTLIKREHPFFKRQAWFLYLGGAIGVLTTVFNNVAFARISVSSILALGLFGQSMAGLIIDQYGLLDMP